MSSIMTKQRGAALLLVLVVLALVSSLLYSSFDQQRFLMRKVAYAEGLQQARVAASTAVEHVKKLLVIDGQGGGVDHLGEMWAAPVPVDTPGAVTYLQIEDAARYWNLNRLVSGEGVVNSKLLQLLEVTFLNYEQDVDVLGEIIDWIDVDDRWSLYGRGREALDYDSEGYKYGPRNGYMQDVSELDLLPLWANVAKLRRIVGVSAACPDSSLNLNTASKAALMVLEGSFSEYQLDTMLSERVDEPFKSVDDALARAQVADVSAEARRLLTVSSGCFNAVIVSQVGDVRVRMTMHIKRTVAVVGGTPQVSITRMVWN